MRRQMLAPRTAKMISFVFAVVATVCFYVHATTNALYESYQPGMQAFKSPFRLLAAASISALLTLLLASIFIPSARFRWKELIRGLGAAAVSASLGVILLGQAPCLRPHPTHEPHETHHSLCSVVERSLLCPRFSIRSYPPLIAALAMGGGLLWMSRRNSAAA